ncbi:MAG: BatD family protein [Mangrovibacterium sp.]
MVKPIKLTVLLCIVLLSSTAQAKQLDCFARVRVSPREAVVRQPIRLTISVYTATWYTQPLQFSNLQIENAFIIPFTQTQPSTQIINKKQYATLTFYYIVYPYIVGDITIPELDITATTPAVDDYKGVEVKVKTREQKITVNDVPDSDGESVWNVASNISFTDKWSKPLDKIKVGDVINRTVKQYAGGTLPSFIAPFEIKKPEGVSLYNSEPELLDRRADKTANGERLEQYSYLFEHEGDIIIPEQEVTWYNPNTKKTYKRTIEEKHITVEPNPDLAMLESLKDSLVALNPQLESQVEDGKKIPWKKIAIYSIIGVFILYWLIKFIIRFVRNVRRKRKLYLGSGKYYYKLFRKELHKGNRVAGLNSLYQWLDKLRDCSQPADVSSYISDELKSEFYNISHSDNSKLSFSEKKTLLEVSKEIKVYFSKKLGQNGGINPV